MRTWMRNVIIFICILIAMIILFYVLIYSRKVDPVPEDSIGNTAGNLYNKGLFCEHDGLVYFSNPYDSNTLYTMYPDESKIAKVSDARVSSLNAAGDYLFYYQDSSAASSSFASMFRINGLYRSKKNGDHAVCLTKSFVPSFVLVGNTIFYQLYDTTLGTSFCRINIDKSDEIELIPQSNINPVSVQNDHLYYAGINGDHALYSMDVKSASITTVAMNMEVYNPIVQGNYVYFMDISGNYCLSRYNFSTQEKEVLTTDRVDCFNLNDNVIYYQRNDMTDPGMMRMNLDGSNPTRIADGIYTNINFTSRYAYFTRFGSDTPLYHSSLSGSGTANEFTAAEQSAMENKD